MGIASRTTKRYTATQVSRLVGVEPHVLRYWEAKFEIKPERNSAGRRIYTEDQVQKLTGDYEKKVTDNLDAKTMEIQES